MRHSTSMIWWRHQMETSSASLALCAGNSPVTGEFPTQRPVTRSFDVSFWNKRLSKQSWDWWFETPQCSLWRHCDGVKSVDRLMFCVYSISHKICTGVLGLCFVVFIWTQYLYIHVIHLPIFFWVGWFTGPGPFAGSNPGARPRYQGSWGQHVAHLGPVGPRWPPCWLHEPCYQRCVRSVNTVLVWTVCINIHHR